MDCKKAQILFAPHIMGDLEPDPEQYHRLEAHLLSCQACRESYDIRKQTIEFIEQNKVVFADLLRTPDEKKASLQKEVEHSWKCIEAGLDELEAQTTKEKSTKFHKLFVRVSAIAACLLIGISIFIAFSIHSKLKFAPKPLPQQVVLTPKPSVKIELLSKNGCTPIPANQQIASGNGLKKLIINNKHCITMNTNTILAVKPLVENANIGCLVKLDSGQIYTHVEHDGNPFVIHTAHGRAVITGTTFDVKVTDDSTTLVVDEGTVQFGSENDVVKVVAGQTSRIVGQSAPTRPILCNAAELTAWAVAFKPESALAQLESNTEPWELPLSIRNAPIALEDADYNTWVEQKRDWFDEQFPWIFELKDALAEEGIEVDYPKLLIKSGDVWQFLCLGGMPARFSMPDFDSLLKTASFYGFNAEWLLEKIPATESILQRRIPSQDTTARMETFDQWLKYAKGENQAASPFYSLEASKFLAETRSLIWFVIKNGKYDLSDDKRAEVLKMLQEEVTAAYNCQTNVLCPSDELKETSCDEETPEEMIVRDIKTMKAIEKRFAEYEINK